MPDLNLTDAHALLTNVVERLYAQRHGPVPGAVVKAAMVSDAASSGTSFNEQALGFKGFSEFVKSNPKVVLQSRLGSDMLIAPIGAEELLSAFAQPLPRLRRDFWRAFIEFAVPGTIRLYDPAEDKIFYEFWPTGRKGIPIEPIARDTQIEWRRTFSEEQPDGVKDALLQALNRAGTGAFNGFAQRLRETPQAKQAWNRYMQKQLTDHVAAWAMKNGVTKDRWSSGFSGSDAATARESKPPKVHAVGQRAELYNFLDQLPLEDLLQLRVPLEWVLKIMRVDK